MVMMMFVFVIVIVIIMLCVCVYDMYVRTIHDAIFIIFLCFLDL